MPNLRSPILDRLAFVLAVLFVAFAPVTVNAGTSSRIESSFELANLRGNPFDFTQNDVQVTIDCPGNRQITLPAFFDGGQTWRVRHTPDGAGEYTIERVTLNGIDAHPLNLRPTKFSVDGSSQPGFIRIDKDHHRFVTDDGSPYYPIGYNLAWRTGGRSPMPPIVETIAGMGRADVNWTRIWMNDWDGKNLDWSVSSADQPAAGALSLTSARLWDQIVQAADANRVRFQLVLQHHGQYSSHADPNWPTNPWNKINGGWLENASQFFSDPRAIAMTRAKYRYIIARWGYSPSIMAFELFNEVESTDGFKTDPAAIAKWLADMAVFIRGQDPYKHLITTSSLLSEPRLWPAMDYYQPHVYPPDILSAITHLDDLHLDRPYFYGEIGAIDDSHADPDATIHRILWGGIMSQSSGAAEYWAWDTVQSKHLVGRFSAAREFVEQSHMLDRVDLKPIDVRPHTDDLGPLVFGPALGWKPSTQTHFKPRADGVIEGIGGMSAFLQAPGGNHDRFPFADFDVDYPSVGTFAVDVDQITAKGARLVISIDGKIAATLDLAGGNPQARSPISIDDTLKVPVTVGKHAIHLENTGGDWVRIRDFVLTPYAARLGVRAKGDRESVFAWVYRQGSATHLPTMSGTLEVPGLAAGEYHVSWWDTDQGRIVKRETISAVDAKAVMLRTPPITKDMALWISH